MAMLSPLHEVETGNARKTPDIPRRDPAARRERGGPYEQIMSPNADSLRRQIRPHSSVDAGGHKVERDQGNSRQDLLDEGLASCANPRGCRSVNAVKKLRRRNRGERYLRVRVIGDDVAPIETTAFGGNQDTRIDQRRHGDFGSLG